MQELLPVLRDIGNRVEQRHYVRKLARLIHVDEPTLMAELNSGQRARLTSQQRGASSSGLPNSPEDVPAAKPGGQGQVVAKAGLEEYCLSLVLAHPTALARANDILEKQDIAGLTANDFKRGVNKEIFKSIQLWTASETPKIDTLIDMAGQALQGHLATLAEFWHRGPPAPTENVNRDLSLVILRLRLQNIREQMNELDFLQQKAKEDNNAENVRQYTLMANAYKQQRRILEQTRDALSLMGKRRAEANIYTN